MTLENLSKKVAIEAQKKLRDGGIHAEVIIIPYKLNDGDVKKEPKDMMEFLEEVLMMPKGSYLIHNRKPDIVALRQIGAVLLRKFYPAITVKQIGLLYGFDHSTICWSLDTAQDRIDTKDSTFHPKYIRALKEVHAWLAK